MNVMLLVFAIIMTILSAITFAINSTLKAEKSDLMGLCDFRSEQARKAEESLRICEDDCAALREEIKKLKSQKGQTIEIMRGMYK